MIKIESMISENLKDDYFRAIHPLVKSKYESVKSVRPINYWMDSILTNLFENEKGEFDLQKLRVILFEPFSEESRARNSFLNNYYQCEMFAHYYPTTLKKNLKGTTNRSNRREIRKECIGLFSNDWLKYHIDVNANYSQSDITMKNLIDEVKQMLDEINAQIRRLMDYSSISSELRHKILTSININVCPYCNRQYTTNYRKGDENRTTAYLDHFYPKSKFQLYSLSLYNFIPSCAVCNSRFKIDRNIEILFPYEQGFNDDAYFKVIPKKPFDITSLLGASDEFEIGIHVNENTPLKDKIKGNIEMFELENIYQTHKNYVRELLYKKTAYSPKYKKMLDEMLINKLTDLEFRLFLFGYSGLEDELYNKPLSKLTNDILKDTDYF